MQNYYKIRCKKKKKQKEANYRVRNQMWEVDHKVNYPCTINSMWNGAASLQFAPFLHDVRTQEKNECVLHHQIFQLPLVPAMSIIYMATLSIVATTASASSSHILPLPTLFNNSFTLAQNQKEIISTRSIIQWFLAAATVFISIPKPQKRSHKNISSQ